MMLPWLRHFPGVKAKFEESKELGPLKMRHLQNTAVK